MLLIDSFSRVSDVSISFANALIAEPKTRPKALIGAVQFTKLHTGPPTDTRDSWREQLNVKIDALEWWCVLLFNLGERRIYFRKHRWAICSVVYQGIIRMGDLGEKDFL